MLQKDVFSHLMQHEICVASRANVLVHDVPVEILQLLRGEIHPRNFVCVMIRCVKAVPIVDIDWTVRMTRSIACHFYF